jgi:uncharacterized surface protein with fasciclin (FAS1) repeats
MKKFLKLITASSLAIALTATFIPQTAQAKSQTPTIVGAALAVNAETGEFSTLIAALKHAGLVSALNGKKQFTVFAPTDAAFAKLGLNSTNVSSLPVDALTKILLGHVKHGRVLAAEVVEKSQIRTLNGEFLKVSVTGEGAFLSSAGTTASKIVATDVETSNGIIHVIDTVLLF